MKGEETTTKRVSPYTRLADECFKLRTERDQLKHRLAVTESNLRTAEGKAEAFKLMVHKLEAEADGYRQGVKDATETILRDRVLSISR